ncbi:MAG: hypothetical protein ABIP75_08510 [Pyrinomonadaceae bacterium]
MWKRLKQIGVDITDEVKAWAEGANLATNPDVNVMGGKGFAESQFRVMSDFNKASTPQYKAAILQRVSSNYANMSTSASGFPSISGVAVGTLILPTSTLSFKG